MRFSYCVLAFFVVGLFGVSGCGNATSESKPRTEEEQKKIDDEMQRLTHKKDNKSPSR
jgi:hypothetical protein